MPPVQGRQKGHVEISGPNGTLEFETFTCGHCNRVIRVPHRANPDDLGGMCRVCMSMTCPRCTSTGKCDPFEEKLKRMEDRGRLLKQVAGI